MKLVIKNMVSLRCKVVVQAVLGEYGLHASNIRLGEVEIAEQLSEPVFQRLKESLSEYNLVLVDDARNLLVLKIKNIINEIIEYGNDLPKSKIPAYMSEKLNYNYRYLMAVFTEVTGTSIENFLITRRIERVKELMQSDDLTLTEISWQLNYSSVGHLSRQFKKVTGYTPTDYRFMNKHTIAV